MHTLITSIFHFLELSLLNAEAIKDMVILMVIDFVAIFIVSLSVKLAEIEKLSIPKPKTILSLFLYVFISSSIMTPILIEYHVTDKVTMWFLSIVAIGFVCDKVILSIVGQRGKISTILSNTIIDILTDSGILAGIKKKLKSKIDTDNKNNVDKKEDKNDSS